MDNFIRSKFSLLFIFFCGPFVTAAGLFDANSIDDLRTDLLASYDRFARPVKNHDHSTNVSFGIGLYQLHLDDDEQLLKMEAWLVMMWKDEYLAWDPVTYGGLEKVHFDEDEIWRPDITIYNSARDTVTPFSKVPLLVMSSGKVMWIPPMHSVTSCSLDMTYWPIDQHDCKVSIGSWAHHGQQINITLIKGNAQITTDNYEVNPKWTLETSSIKRKETVYTDDKYVHLDLSVTLKRRATTQLTFISNSSLCVMVIVLLSYGLPVKYKEGKLLLHALGIIINSIYGTILYASIPSHNGDMPAVVRFYCGQMMLCIMSLICTVIIITCCSCPEEANKSSTSVIIVKIQGLISKIPVLKRIIPNKEPELQYHTLDEELNIDNTSQSTLRHNNPTNEILYTTLSRLFNFIFFFLFFLAFVIDYAALRSYGKK